MRPRILWTIVMLAVVLIVIALMRFNLTALHQPGPVETDLVNLPSVSSFTAQVWTAFPRAPWTQKQALEEEVHTTG